jgi:hypothetical protein
MVYEYPFWEEVLIEEDGLEILNFALTEIDNELNELNFNLEDLDALESLNFNLAEIIELEILNEGNDTNNNKRKFILID